ncbi:hypothetical protein PQQ64_32445 [Paraburkholderia graminis]|uniref:bestrophin-like domain n=1 Tax=Paraburkholderia graminis TaxID=60548 RepID=UPI0038B8D5CF
MEQVVSFPRYFFIVTFVLMSMAAWIGAALLRRSKPLDSDARKDFEVVKSATLTLLALVIGFSLSMAVGRYDQRKNYEEEEANAIGTEFLRADLLPAAEAAAIRSLLAQYIEQRIRFYQVRDPHELDEINSKTAELQTELWAAAHTGAAHQPTPLTALAVAGMNDVINTQGYTQAAWRNRLPLESWSLMIVLGVFSNLLVGYGSRSTAPKKLFLLIMPTVVALSFMLIADIDSPRRGVIRVVPQNLMSTAHSLPKS